MNEDTYNIASATSNSGEDLIIPIKWDFESVNVLKVVAVANGNAEILNSGYSWNDTLKQLEVQNNYGYEEWSVYVMREEDAQNVLQLISTSEVNAQNIVEQFNRTNRVVQQIQVNQRASICVPDEVNGLLPDANTRKGKFISFDEDGKPVANIEVDTLAQNRAGAVLAQSKAVLAQSKAETAQSKAETAQKKAETSESNAKGYAESASKSASNASTSEKNALSYCTSASTSATSASTSAINASTSEKNAKESALKAESYGNLSSIYKNAVMRMMKGEDSVCELRFKTEDNKLVLVKAEIVDGVPMLIPSIATTGTTQTAISVLRWETANGERFDVFAEIIDGVPVLSCAK